MIVSKQSHNQAHVFLVVMYFHLYVVDMCTLDAADLNPLLMDL